MSDSGAVASFLLPLIEIELPTRPTLNPFNLSWWTARISPKDGELDRPFTVIRQDQPNWCWASVGVALHEFRSGERRQQCALAQKVRNPVGISCCTHPSHPQCDHVELISRVLAALEMPHRPVSPPVSFDAITSDIDANRPVICLMSGGGTQHYVVIVAWYIAGGIPWLKVDDPADGLRYRVRYSAFYENYRGRHWVQTMRLV